MTRAGLPHSDTCGLMLACSYPQLFAACRVLLRLLMPRHSPSALISLLSTLLTLLFGTAHKMDAPFASCDNSRYPISHFLTNYAIFNVPSPAPAGMDDHLRQKPFLNIFWWRWPDSNRRPPACKAGALPAKLHPPSRISVSRVRLKPKASSSNRASNDEQRVSSMVGLSGLEPETSPLSGVRSNHLS